MVVRRLIRKKECCPGFTCDYVIGEDRRLKGLFWADEQSKTNYTVFGDIVGFDATYKSNKYDLVFVPFTGIDNHFRNVTFGGALLVVTDQDAAMKRAIKDVLSRSRHRLCMWHIWEKLKTKVGPVLLANIDFNTRMTHIVWNDTIIPEDFETEWHSIMSTFGLGNHEWLKDMYDLRFDWIPAYYHGENLAGLMRTTSRCESENYFFGQICNPRCTLVEFFTHFETAMNIQRHEHRRNDHDTRRDLNLYIGEYDAEMVVRRLIRKKECCPGFTCDYVIGEDRRLKGLFWADEQSKTNYTVFGDIVGFDATYKSNKYDLVFVPFTGIDNHFRNVTFGGALLGSETADS
ncbi:protein FAR1-RELATED SEQUENCE 5-like [Helianthus annuus]|uniref:protein FAR1-RELATED SEQUENCE 5-like n=1 Tax=Helianthus annuus TaxID=4232 RepID=UPI000B908B08|nr:protein FAR1-RELATED SEQUENCE 5-like [Helianthus annuus]